MLDLIEISFFTQKVQLHEVNRKSELRCAQEVQYVAEKRPIPVDEVVSLSVPCGGEVAAEHGTQHGVWVTLKSGDRGRVEVTPNI